MRRLVIGIMLVLFAVGAYSQGDDMYVLSKETKSKGNKARIEYLSSKEWLSDDEKVELSFRKNVWGEWRTNEGQFVSINRNEIEIEGVAFFRASASDKRGKTSYGFYLNDWHYYINHPFLPIEITMYCNFEIAVYDENHIILGITEKGGKRTYRLTRVY